MLDTLANSKSPMNKHAPAWTACKILIIQKQKYFNIEFKASLHFIYCQEHILIPSQVLRFLCL